MDNNMNDTIKVAFIGGGINSAAGLAHYTAINMDNNYRLVAGSFSRQKDINQKTAERYKVSPDRVYKNIDELIENEKQNIDAVIILTPPEAHATEVISLINNEIPVICEKPLGYSTSEVVQIRDLLLEKRGFLSVIYNYLGYPMIRELGNKIRKGDLGKIIHVQVEMPQEGFARINQENQPVVPQTWRLKDGSIPTLSLDLGVHLHMLINYLIREAPINVVAKSESLGNFSEIIDNVNCLIEYTNDLTCNMWYSKVALGNRNGLKLRIFGQNASAEWIQEFPETLKIAYSNSRRAVLDRGNDEMEVSNQPRYTRFKVGHPVGYLEAFANYYQDIHQALFDYRNYTTSNIKDCVGVEEAYEGMKLFDAIQRSSKSRSWEKV